MGWRRRGRRRRRRRKRKFVSARHSCEHVSRVGEIECRMKGFETNEIIDRSAGFC